MLYLNNFTLLILKVLLFECIVAFPNKYEEQDVDTNEKFDLVNSLRDYHENNTENEHQRNAVKNGSIKSWRWMDGKWMPSQSGGYIPPSKLNHKEGDVPMGVQNVMCDDGKTNLTVDWDGSRNDYTCYGKKIVPDLNTAPEYYNATVPKYFAAMHRCMYRPIKYTEAIPLFGTHRPEWPAYGEYTYLPPQRWLHSLEHGAVVMLYHSCANKPEVEKLKKLVRGCLRRHIISPNNLLDEKRPLALLTWGRKLTMSYVNESIVKQFILDTALQGLEDISDDGDFNEKLIKEAKEISDESDSVLCPSKPKKLPINEIIKLKM